jgi:hypothetical protein
MLKNRFYTSNDTQKIAKTLFDRNQATLRQQRRNAIIFHFIIFGLPLCSTLLNPGQAIFQKKVSYFNDIRNTIEAIENTVRILRKNNLIKPKKT